MKDKSLFSLFLAWGCITSKTSENECSHLCMNAQKYTEETLQTCNKPIQISVKYACRQNCYFHAAVVGTGGVKGLSRSRLHQQTHFLTTIYEVTSLKVHLKVLRLENETKFSLFVSHTGSEHLRNPKKNKICTFFFSNWTLWSRTSAAHHNDISSCYWKGRKIRADLGRRKALEGYKGDKIYDMDVFEPVCVRPPHRSRW